ncbi:hypothetical protein E2562_009293 [Oryza meyeriana var. granulata]|uniref:Uncharacterized protein n=1 Tax=Oryza meyeriana var. granulata TaxID=110450 RepID=A0A6G1EAV2_9ORYZ|nr:hypothetical protein E2562_009293 [Oryza meyeriana var. granulata]
MKEVAGSAGGLQTTEVAPEDRGRRRPKKPRSRLLPKAPVAAATKYPGRRHSRRLGSPPPSDTRVASTTKYPGHCRPRNVRSPLPPDTLVAAWEQRGDRVNAARLATLKEIASTPPLGNAELTPGNAELTDPFTWV